MELGQCALPHIGALRQGGFHLVNEIRQAPTKYFPEHQGASSNDRAVPQRAASYQIACHDPSGRLDDAQQGARAVLEPAAG